MELNSVTSGSLMDWHEKLGHMNFQTLRQTISNRTVDDLTVINLSEENPFCEGCALGKQHRKPFLKDEVVRSQHCNVG